MVSVVDEDPKLFAGSGSGARGYGSGSGSGTGLEPNQISSRKFDNDDIKNTLILHFY
jgi:hypothetical protein